jgi:hypothetical protein
MKLSFGVPLWLMKTYLIELGAIEKEDGLLAADKWQVVMSKGKPIKVGSLVVGKVDVELSGDETSIAKLLEKLYLKTLRGGG